MPDSPVHVTASVEGQQDPAAWTATFSNPVLGVNTTSVVVIGPSGDPVTGAAFFVPGGGTGPSFITLDGVKAPALSVVFVPGANVRAVPVCGSCLLNVEGGTPTDEMPPGDYTMTLSGLTDARGRTIPDITVNFSVTCVTATLTGARVGGSITLAFTQAVKLTQFIVTNPFGVSTNLSGVVSPAFGVASAAFTAAYGDGSSGTFAVNVSWTNADGTCATSGLFHFIQAS